MANPSRYSMFIRLVGGNVASPYPGTLDPGPDNDESKISGHDFIAALQMWDNGEISKVDVVAHYNLTHVDDGGDLDDLKAWYVAATKRDKFANVLEWRIILARDKKGTAGLDGAFNYAVKSTLINGADGTHSLGDTGPVAERFNTWA